MRDSPTPAPDSGVNEPVDPETVQKALHAANNLVVLTDARLPDNPIVWVNDYFCQFTGYSREEVIGRNCRFLQGDDRDQPERYELREAVEDARRTHVLIRNFKKSGELFYNDLYISPVIEDGEVHYFIGVQNDVTVRVRAQQDVIEAERRVHETAENERERFGMDLHDGLGQTLAGATMLSHALSRDLEAFGREGGVLDALPEEIRGQVRELARHAEMLHAHINRTVSEARAMARGLNPVDDNAQGLGDALRALADQMQSRQGEAPRVVVQAEDVEFSDRRQARHLYRIAQEAVSNAVRHAGATEVAVTLHRAPHAVHLEVADDGSGIGPDEGRREGECGRGLASMRHRARLIGADFQIRSRPGGGTVVRTVVPDGAQASDPTFP